MSNIVKIKRRNSGSPGAPASLKSGEFASNEVDSILYYGAGDDGGGNATSILAIAGPGAFLLLATSQTVTGNKTFTGSIDMTGGTPTVPTATLTDSTTKAASTAFVQGQFPSVSGTTAPKVTFNSKGLITGSTTLVAGDIPSLTHTAISDFDTQVRTSRLDQMATPSANVSMGSNRITSLADPITGTDAATQAYVLAQIASSLTGQDWKGSVRVASTANVSVSGGGIANGVVIDGVTIATGDRVLLKDQTTGSENGIYVAPASGAATRATDMDTSAEASPGSTIVVEEGTVGGSTVWILTTHAPITLGTTSLTFTELPGSVSIVGTTNRITVTGNQVDVSAAYVGQSSITTLGTVTTGVWNATTVAGAYGGLGAALSTITDGALLKRSGTAVVTAAVGTDYLSNSSTIDCGTF